MYLPNDMVPKDELLYDSSLSNSFISSDHKSINVRIRHGSRY